jgi:lysophospholipase L1-like esterase
MLFYISMNKEPNAVGVLCFGDSITWGHNPPDPGQLPDRYPVVMQEELLPGKYEVIERSLRGRTVSGPNPYGEELAGAFDGLASFRSDYGQIAHRLGVVIIMLGTNDANDRLHKSPEVIADGLHGYFDVMEAWRRLKRYPLPKKTILVALPPVEEDSLFAGERMYRGAGRITRELPPYIRRVAEAHGAHFFEAGTVASTAEADGVHLNSNGHRALGRALATEVQLLFADDATEGTTLLY